MAAFTGASGAGKTFLLCALIGHCRERGIRVAAIKHTHHPLNEERRGDSARLERAGAEPVLLAGDSEAVVFRAGSITRIAYVAAPDLLRNVDDAAVVLIEGFKRDGDWPRIEVRREARPSVAEILLSLERMWRA